MRTGTASVVGARRHKENDVTMIYGDMAIGDMWPRVNCNALVNYIPRAVSVCVIKPFRVSDKLVDASLPSKLYVEVTTLDR